MGIFRYLVLAALSACLVGCGAARRAEMAQAQEAAGAQAATERAACTQRFPTSVPRTRVAFARCLADVDNRLLRPYFSAPELFDVIVAKRTALASQVDAGQITQEESDFQFAQTKSQVIGELDRRGLARRAVAAQEAANSFSCTKIGNTISCF